jgi:hypothetical protein
MALEKRRAQQNWQAAACSAYDLSRLFAARGKLTEAVQQGWESVDLASKSHDTFCREGARLAVAAALHAKGLRKEAADQFEEAKRIREARRPDYPLLDWIGGFRYCDLLLDEGRIEEVRRRAKRDRSTPRPPWYATLDDALDHLALGRAHLLGVQRGSGGSLAEATSHLAASADGLRCAGYEEFLPLGLLARAALHTHTRAFDLARKDLDAVLRSASRCGFRLHEADAHLGLARLALAQGNHAEATSHRALARRIIHETGYHRRDGELDELTCALDPAAPTS